MSAAPVRHCVQIIGQRRVLKDLSFLMLRISWKGEGVVCGCSTAEEQDEVPGVLADVGVGGAGGGDGSEKVEVRDVVFGVGVRV